MTITAKAKTGAALRGLLAGAALACAALGAQAEELRFLMPWNQSSTGNWATADLLTEVIEEASGGEITLRRFDNSVVPPFEQFEPVASGVFDLHYTSPAYHSGNTSIGQLMDTATDDLERRRSSGLWDMIDAEYQKLGIKVIALGPSTGYQFLLRAPTNEGTLDGLQIRSNPAYDTIIEEFGGAPIQLPMPEVFTALQKGLIDGTAFPLHGLQGRKMWEVTDYIVRPSFGQGTAFVGMNLDKWNALSPGMQETMLEAGRMFEARAFEVVNALAQEDEAAMKANGVEITELSDDYAARIDEIFNRGIWRRAIANSGEAAETIVAFIEDNGLATHD